MKNILLSVVIVNYNTSDLLKTCLRSLIESLKISSLIDLSEIIVIDNASQDDSIEMLNRNFKSVKIISNKENYGFAKANNLGIAESKGEFILLLNTDARVQKDAVAKSLDKFTYDSEIGVVGGKLLFEDGSLQMSAGFFPTLASVINWMFFIDDIKGLNKFLKAYHVVDPSFYNNPHEVDWVTGAFFLIRKNVIKKAGLLDESVFMYGEEVEWCYRIKKNRYKVIYSPESEIVHDKGGSSKSGKNAGIIEEFKFILYFFSKYSNSIELFCIKLILKLGILLRIGIFGILSKYQDRKHLYEKALSLV